MMKNVIPSASLPLFCAFFLCSFAGSVQAETIRDRALIHFNLVKWATADDPPVVASEGSVIPGGTETFAVLGSDRESGVPALYPSIDELGVLDYSDLDQGLVDVLYKLAKGLQFRQIDGSLCYPDRPFIPVIANYQVGRLPAPDLVLFSRPLQDDSGAYSVCFRLRFSDENKNGDAKTVLAYAKVGRVSGMWYLCEFYFDGERYAALARSN